MQPTQNADHPTFDKSVLGEIERGILGANLG